MNAISELPGLCIIVPTYQEKENIALLCQEIRKELDKGPDKIKYEILIMDDDSKDGSDKVVDKLTKQKYPVRIINRKGKTKGLSAAVIDGLQLSNRQYCCVMDADLSHPASSIKPMLAKLRQGKTDFCLGSRYVAGGSLDEKWDWRRKFASTIATLLALPLQTIKDPMSGFFLLRKEDIPPLHKLSAIGYKIALELIVKGSFKNIYEHPIHFSQRRFGESKMDLRQQFFYLRHLRRLYQYRYPVMSEFVQFSFVGGTGFILDIACYYSFQYFFALEHTVARGLSFWVAASWNWFWNRTITFSNYFKDRPLGQWLAFLLVSICGFSINWGCYFMLTSYVPFFIENKFLSLVLGVLAGLGFNFISSRIFIFSHIEDD